MKRRYTGQSGKVPRPPCVCMGSLQVLRRPPTFKIFGGELVIPNDLWCKSECPSCNKSHISGLKALGNSFSPPKVLENVLNSFWLLIEEARPTVLVLQLLLN